MWAMSLSESESGMFNVSSLTIIFPSPRLETNLYATASSNARTTTLNFLKFITIWLYSSLTDFSIPQTVSIFPLWFE